MSGGKVGGRKSNGNGPVRRQNAHAVLARNHAKANAFNGCKPGEGAVRSYSCWIPREGNVFPDVNAPDFNVTSLAKLENPPTQTVGGPP